MIISDLGPRAGFGRFASEGQFFLKYPRIYVSNLGESYSAFVQGFGTTSNDTVTILSSSGNVVTAQLIAEQNDGSTKTFAGTYTVTNGIITSVDVQQTG